MAECFKPKLFGELDQSSGRMLQNALGEAYPTYCSRVQALVVTSIWGDNTPLERRFANQLIWITGNYGESGKSARETVRAPKSDDITRLWHRLFLCRFPGALCRRGQGGRPPY